MASIYSDLTVPQLKEWLEKLKLSIKKHKILAFYGIAKSKARLRELNSYKAQVETLLKEKR